MCVGLCVGVCGVVYVLRVCGMCVLCFGVVVCCAVSLCVVLVLVLVCNVWCVVSVVCVRGVCVVCVRCGVCLLSVCNVAWHAENPPCVAVCSFKTPPCVPAKRAHVELSSLLLSLFRRSSFSLSLVLFYLPSSLLFSLCSFSATMTMITRSVGSLCTQSSDLPECQCAWASVHSLFGEHVRIMQETSVVPLGMKWACICAGNECCVLVVFGCVSMCQYVIVCVSVCCLRCVVGCVSVGVDALAVVWW